MLGIYGACLYIYIFLHYHPCHPGVEIKPDTNGCGTTMIHRYPLKKAQREELKNPLRLGIWTGFPHSHGGPPNSPPWHHGVFHETIQLWAIPRLETRRSVWSSFVMIFSMVDLFIFPNFSATIDLVSVSIFQYVFSRHFKVRSMLDAFPTAHAVVQHSYWHV